MFNVINKHIDQMFEVINNMFDFINTTFDACNNMFDACDKLALVPCPPAVWLVDSDYGCSDLAIHVVTVLQDGSLDMVKNIDFLTQLLAWAIAIE